MEDLLSKMESSAISDQKDNKSYFEGLYKNWGKSSDQEERRKEILKTQKSNRNTNLDLCRGILDLVKEEEEKDVFQSKKKVYYRPNIYVSGFNQAPSTYKNVLMMSEWLIEKPSDFNENWLMVPCPKGVRMLVISHRGKTKFFNKYGQFKIETQSVLPAGNSRDQSYKKNSCCVLDCFYQEINKTAYVLDFLVWNNQTMTECDTEFRHFWLQSQFAENPEFGEIGKINKCKFELLPKYNCKPEELNKFLMTYPAFENDFPGLDGLLFYHKQAHYISGQTPLVGWLYPYMVNELLGSEYTLHEEYIARKPVSYVDQATFIQMFQAKHLRSKQFEQSYPLRSSFMDTTESKNNEENKMEA